VKLKEGPIALPAAGETIRLPVENQYDFTDLSELRVEWQIGVQHGLAQATGLPHQAGEIQIKLSRPPAAGQVLDLKIRDRQGRLVDAYELPFGQASERMPDLRSPAPEPLRIVHEDVLAGPGTRVSGCDFDLVFDEASGGLRRGVAFGQAVLLELPRVHLLSAADPLHSLPDPLSWRLRKLDVRMEGSNVRVQLEGSYEHLEGGYDLLITPQGTLTIQSAFKYSGEDKQMPNGVEVAYFIERKEDHADGIRNSASNQQKDGG